MLCGKHRVWSSKECVCCACYPSVYLDVPSIGFVYVCVYRILPFCILCAHQNYVMKILLALGMLVGNVV